MYLEVYCRMCAMYCLDSKQFEWKKKPEALGRYILIIALHN